MCWWRSLVLSVLTVRVEWVIYVLTAPRVTVSTGRVRWIIYVSIATRTVSSGSHGVVGYLCIDSAACFCQCWQTEAGYLCTDSIMHWQQALLLSVSTNMEVNELEIRNTSTTTKTRVTYGNSHLVCVQILLLSVLREWGSFMYWQRPLYLSVPLLVSADREVARLLCIKNRHLYFSVLYLSVLTERFVIMYW